VPQGDHDSAETNDHVEATNERFHEDGATEMHDAKPEDFPKDSVHVITADTLAAET